MRPVNVALAPFLRSCPTVTTIGIRALLGEYSKEERALLAQARRIFYPTIRFVDVFHAAGKICFPSYFNHKLQRSRVLQTTLLEYSGCPHPPARIYFGPRQKSRIPMDFAFPFVVMGPHVKSETRHLVKDESTLKKLSDTYNPVIVQAHEPWRETIRLICVAFDCLAAFRTRINHAETAAAAPMPTQQLLSMDLWDKTRTLLIEARLDDMAVEWGLGEKGWQLIDMNRPPVLMEFPGGMLHRHDHVCRLITEGLL